MQLTSIFLSELIKNDIGTLFNKKVAEYNYMLNLL
jgi:hypothetical protein